MSQNRQGSVTRCRDENAATLQQYANNKRFADQFNDVTVVAGSESISANRLVLSCYSKFFESMFLSPMKERYQNEVEVQTFDGKAVRALIDFMYSGKIMICSENVVHLLAVADFLQMEDVKQFCFEFLEDNLSIDNCLEMVTLSTQYNCSSSLKKTYELIGENMNLVVQTDTFKKLCKSDLVSLISSLDSSAVKQSSVYNAILRWTREDDNRKVNFAELFLFIELQSLSIQFLDEVVSNEPLVKESTVCLSALTAGIFAKLKDDHQKGFKILCVNADLNHLVVEIDSKTGNIGKAYPPVPYQPQDHCLLKLNNFLYCIGGYCTEGCYSGRCDIAYRLNLSEPNLQWTEVASMSMSRECFGAAVYNGCVVVNGNLTGTKSTEAYDVGLNRWRNIAATNKSRACHRLVATDGALFAIGGTEDCFIFSVSSAVERLDDLNGQWREVQPMNTPRFSFAAVACLGYIYVIGGYSTKLEKTVEKYDPKSNTWTFVCSMNVERKRSAASVFQNKIYVIGGRNADEQVVKTIDCYDPELDQWTIVGDTELKCSDQAVVL